MKRILDFFWPLMGFAAVAVSLWLLRQEFKGEAVGPDVWEHVKSISLGHHLLAMLSTLVAYAALAWYDRIALLHLGVKNISWVFISLCSFTTYALAHNIGATVFSGGVVRYRAYHSKGLSAAQVAVLVAVCSLTFALGTVLLGGIISVLEPEQLGRFRGMLPEKFRFLTDPTTARLVGVVFLSGIAIYVAGSIFRFRPLMIRGFRLDYPGLWNRRPATGGGAPRTSRGRWNHLFRFARCRQSRLFCRARCVHLFVFRRALVQCTRRAWRF